MNQTWMRRRSCLGRMRRETNESRIRQQTRNMGGKRVIGQHGGSRGLVNQVPDMLTGSPSFGTPFLRGIDGDGSKYERLRGGSYGIALWAMAGWLLASRRGDPGLESVLGLTRALVAVVMVGPRGWMRKRQRLVVFWSKGWMAPKKSTTGDEERTIQKGR